MVVKWCIDQCRGSKFVLFITFQNWFVRQEMNRLLLYSIFSSGVILAIFIAVLHNYFRVEVFTAISARKIQKSFSPLPDESQLRATEESSLGLVLRKASVSRIDEHNSKNEACITEAVSSLNAALEMRKMGKSDKALKLFQHAVALAPKHPDILNFYGEFLEETQNDIVTADHLYFQALSISPSHFKAMENRQRTAPVVEEIERLLFSRIDNKRDKLSAIPDSNSAFRRAKKEAYFQHIYHTAGIEGNTMTLIETRSIIETQMAIGGKSIMEHNEILGLDAAMKYINATLVNRLGTISVDDIVEIHRRVMGFVDPLESGRFRRTQVYVGGHIPPGPSEINVLMKEFSVWLNTEESMRMHPIRYAALAHYKLVHIHPFSDGNGRTARLLMNTILMQAGFPPVIILKEDRHKYYEYLNCANMGDVRPFVRFIADCTERTLDMFLWVTNEYSSNVPALGPDFDGKTIIVEDFDEKEGER